MAVRPIDGNELYRIEKLLDTDIVRQDKVALNLLEQVLYDIQHVPTLTPPNEWVSVEERLPDNKGEYLVAYHPCIWDFVSDEICVGFDSFRGKTTWAKKKYQRVTHWMPLPEPPDSRPPEGEEDTP